MDVTLFTPRFYPAISGGEFYLLNIALNLKKLYEDNTSIICSNSVDFKGLRSKDGLILDENNPHYYHYKKIPIQRVTPNYEYLENKEKFNYSVENLQSLARSVSLSLDNKVISGLLRNGLNLTSYFSDLVANRKNLGIDVIHSTFLPYSSLLYSLILARYQKIPAVCTPFYHIFNPRYDKNIYIDILKEFDGIVACTDAEKDFLNEKGIKKSKIRTIPMGVDYDFHLLPVKSKSGRLKSFKKKFSIENPFILFCGYKNYEKGAISLLQSTELINEKEKKVSYVFIGPTTTAFDIELGKIRKKGIEILNLTPQSMKGYYDWRKISAYQECSVFVMPSRSDAYGMAYLEAWAAGKPVIAARNTVMEE
ncbi:MAG: glycosyltransferase family 4 protein, partial [archaeon]|nr:glycosyltransferase family 4 protein [archaeon]